MNNKHQGRKEHSGIFRRAIDQLAANYSAKKGISQFERERQRIFNAKTTWLDKLLTLLTPKSNVFADKDEK